MDARVPKSPSDVLFCVSGGGKLRFHFVATREGNTEQQYSPLQKEGDVLKEEEVQTKGVQEEWERKGRR